LIEGRYFKSAAATGLSLSLQRAHAQALGGYFHAFCADDFKAVVPVLTMVSRGVSPLNQQLN